MKRILYICVIIGSVTFFSFIVRESILRQSKKYNDRQDLYIYYREYEDGTDHFTTETYSSAIYARMHSADEDDLSCCRFLVKSYHGHIAIFNLCGSLCRETAIVVDGLDNENRNLMLKGVYFHSMEDVEKYINTF